MIYTASREKTARSKQDGWANLGQGGAEGGWRVWSGGGTTDLEALLA